MVKLFQDEGRASWTYGEKTAPLAEGNWMTMLQNTVPQLGANEMTSLNALIAYVASKTGVAEFRVERTLADHFNVPNMKCLPSENYEAAVTYLVDLIDGGKAVGI